MTTIKVKPKLLVAQYQNFKKMEEGKIEIIELWNDSKVTLRLLTVFFYRANHYRGINKYVEAAEDDSSEEDNLRRFAKKNSHKFSGGRQLHKKYKRPRHWHKGNMSWCLYMADAD